MPENDMLPVQAEVMLPATMEATPAMLLTLAVQKDLDMEKLKGLMDLQERWDAREARKAYFDAVAKFQATVPPITKNKAVAIPNGPHYGYATLDHIITTIKDTLAACGLSYRFEQADMPDGGMEVACISTHVSGHSEASRMSAGPDESGKKNAIQSRGSSNTYLKRYTLSNVYGLVIDEDNDGQTSRAQARKAEPPEPQIPDDWPPVPKGKAEPAPAPAANGLPPDIASVAERDLVEGQYYSGTLAFLQHNTDWWNEGDPATVWAEGSGKRGMKLLCFAGLMDGKWKKECATTSNPMKHGWGNDGDVLTFRLDTKATWLDVRKKGAHQKPDGKPVKAKPHILSDVRLASEWKGAPGGTTTPSTDVADAPIPPPAAPVPPSPAPAPPAGPSVAELQATVTRWYEDFKGDVPGLGGAPAFYRLVNSALHRSDWQKCQDAEALGKLVTALTDANAEAKKL